MVPFIEHSKHLVKMPNKLCYEGNKIYTIYDHSYTYGFEFYTKVNGLSGTIDLSILSVTLPISLDSPALMLRLQPMLPLILPPILPSPPMCPPLVPMNHQQKIQFTSGPSGAQDALLRNSSS